MKFKKFISVSLGATIATSIYFGKPKLIFNNILVERIAMAGPVSITEEEKLAKDAVALLKNFILTGNENDYKKFREIWQKYKDNDAFWGVFAGKEGRAGEYANQIKNDRGIVGKIESAYRSKHKAYDPDELVDAVRSAYQMFSKGDMTPILAMAKEHGPDFVKYAKEAYRTANPLEKPEKMEKPGLPVSEKAPAVQAYESYRNYILGNSISDRNSFMRIWPKVSSEKKERDMFFKLVSSDTYLNELETGFGNAMKSPERLIEAIRNCFEELSKDKPDRAVLERNYGKTFVDFLAKNKKEFSWVLGTDAAQVLEQKKSTTMFTELQGKFHDHVLAPEYYFAGVGEASASITPISDQEAEAFVKRDRVLAEVLMVIYDKMANPNNVPILEARYGEKLVRYVMQNKGNLEWLTKHAADVAAHIGRNADTQLISNLRGLWTTTISGDKSIRAATVYEYRPLIVGLEKARKEAAEKKYGSAFMMQMDRVRLRAESARQIGQTLLPLCLTGFQGGEREKQILGIMEKLQDMYKGDKAFVELALSFLPEAMKAGFQAYRASKPDELFTDFAKHALGMRKVFEREAKSMHLPGRKDKADYETIYKVRIDEQIQKGDARWKSFVTMLAARTSAYYKGELEVPEHLITAKDLEKMDKQAVFQMMRRAAEDRFYLNNLLSTADYTHTMTPQWTINMKILLDRIRGNMEKDKGYMDAFVGQDVFATSKALKESYGALSSYNQKVSELKKKYGAAMVEYLQESGDAIQALYNDKTITSADQFMEKATALGIMNVKAMEQYSSLNRPERLIEAIRNSLEELSKSRPDLAVLERNYGKPFVDFLAKNRKEFSWALGTDAAQVLEQKKNTAMFTELQGKFHDHNADFLKVFRACHDSMQAAALPVFGSNGAVAKYGEDFVYLIGSNMDRLSGLAEDPPKDEVAFKKAEFENAAFKTLASMLRKDEKYIEMLKSRIFILEAFHTDVQWALMSGARVQAEFQLLQQTAGATDMTTPESRNMLARILTDTASLSPVNIERLRRHTLGPLFDNEKLPFEWRKRVLERYLPQAASAVTPGQLRKAYEEWMGRLDRTVTVKDDMRVAKAIRYSLQEMRKGSPDTEHLTRLYGEGFVKIISDPEMRGKLEWVMDVKSADALEKRPEIKEPPFSELSAAYEYAVIRPAIGLKDFKTVFNDALFTLAGDKGYIETIPDKAITDPELKRQFSGRVNPQEAFLLFASLSVETQEALYRLISRTASKRGMDVKSYITSKEGISQFIEMCRGVGQIDVNYGHPSMLLDLIGDVMLKHQPWEIAIVINYIAGQVSILTNASAYHMIPDYYNILPGEITNMFVTAEDMYRKSIAGPGILVKSPAEDIEGEIRTAYTNTRLRIPRRVYFGGIVANNAGIGGAVTISSRYNLSQAPVLAPAFGTLDNEYFKSGLFSATVSTPIYPVRFPFALSQLYRLSLKRTPNIGRWYMLNASLRKGYEYNKTAEGEAHAGNFDVDARFFGHGKEVGAKFTGSYTGERFDLGQVSSYGKNIPKEDMVAAYRTGVLAPVSLLGLMQAKGAVTGYDLTVTTDVGTNDVSSLRFALSTMAPGGIDTAMVLRWEKDAEGKLRPYLRVFKRGIGENETLSRMFTEHEYLPLTTKEAEYLYQRAYEAAPAVYKGGLGARDLKVGRGAMGAEGAVIFAQSSALQGLGLYTPFGKKIVNIGAYEHTREGRVLHGAGVLDPNARIMGFGSVVAMGTGDPRRLRILGQFELIREGAEAGGRVKKTPISLRVFVGAGKYYSPQYDEKGFMMYGPDGKVLLAQGGWKPMMGGVLSMMHNWGFWKVAGLYTQESTGGGGAVANKSLTRVLGASFLMRQLATLYTQQMLYGEKMSTEPIIIDQSVLRGKLYEASLGAKALFPGVPLGVILGSAFLYYKPPPAQPTAVGQEAVAPPVERTPPTASKRLPWESVSALELGNINNLTAQSLYTLMTGTAAPSTLTAEEYSAMPFLQLKLYPRGVIGLEALDINGIGVLNKRFGTGAFERMGGMGGPRLRWTPVEVELYVGAGRKRYEVEGKTEEEKGAGVFGEAKLFLGKGLRTQLQGSGGFMPWLGLERAASGGLRFEKPGRWIGYGIYTYADEDLELLRTRTQEYALGLGIKVTDTFLLHMLQTGTFQADRTNNLNSMQHDTQVGFKYYNERFSYYNFALGARYWQAERLNAALSPADKYNLSNYLAIARFGYTFWKGQAVLGVDLYGGQERETHKLRLGVFGTLTVNTGLEIK